jgi:hypothetical protein
MNRHGRRRQRAMDRENRFRIAHACPHYFSCAVSPLRQPDSENQKVQKIGPTKIIGNPRPGLRPMRRRSRGYARRHRRRCCLNFLTLLKIQAPEVIRAV